MADIHVAEDLWSTGMLPAAVGLDDDTLHDDELHERFAAVG